MPTNSESPPLVSALVVDARAAARFRGEYHRMGNRWVTAGQMVRLALESDAYLAQVCYRIGASARQHGVPLVPRLMKVAAAVVAQVHIGPEAVVGPGLYLAHGQVDLHGPVRLADGVVMFPWSTIDSSGGEVTIGTDVRVGTGAVINGPASVGAHTRIGANAVVTGDVAAHSRVAGVPARPVGANSKKEPQATPVIAPEDQAPQGASTRRTSA